MTISALIFASALPQTVSVNLTATIGGRPVRDAVIYLKGTAKPKPSHFDIVQINKKFEPRILVVPVGSTVGFPNRDDVFHNVFAEYNAKKFDLGMYPKGQTRSVTFDKVGVVSVLCNVHSSMSAYIIIVDSNKYGKSNSRGILRLSDVPKGSYELTAWHESGAKLVEKLVVENEPIEKVLKLKK